MKKFYALVLLFAFAGLLRMNAQCQAGFSFTQSNDTIVFTDTSSVSGGNITSWSWDFGNMTFSNLQNPQVMYGVCGMYIVTLNITTDIACSGSFTDTIYVNGTLDASWTFTATPGNNNVQFNANQNFGHLEYKWQFGDGDSSALPAINHLYAATGTYNVCLMLSDTNGICINDTSCNAVTVYPPCSASFSFTTSADTVFFANASSAPGDSITGYTWTFGDMTGSVASNPNHIFSSCGMYIVQLNMTTNSGCTGMHTDTVYISTPLAAAFTYTVNNTNGNVIFNAAPVSNATYAWNFGNGNNGTGVATAETYTNGNYVVCLTVTDTNGICGNGVFCDTVAVWVTPQCQAAFSFAMVSNDSVSFTDLSTIVADTIAQWNWNFGDGATDSVQHPNHIYSACGEYIVTLSIVTNSNCTSTFTDTLAINGQINGNYTYTIGGTSGTASFNATPVNANYTYSWDFGDGNTGSGASTTNTYSNGTYTACVIIADTTGLCGADTVCKSFTVTILPCQASFSYSQSGTTFTFTNTSSTQTGTIINNFWNFGDFTTSAQVNPVHTYNTCGIYIVNLSIITNTGCTNTFSDTIVVPGQVNGNYTYTIDSITGSTQFFGSPNNANYSFAWDFGDGGTGTGANPTHTYTNGTYTACVIITQNSGGCSPDTVCQTIVVALDTTPNCTVTWTNFGNGNFQSFTANPFSFTDNYAWDFGDGSTGSGPFATHNYAAPGTYTVCVVYTDQQGCSATFCDTVNIQAQTCNITFTYSANGGGSFDFNATTTGGGFFPVVLWFSPTDSTLFAFGDSITHQFSSNGFHIVCAVLNPGGLTGCSDTVCTGVFITGVGIEEFSLLERSIQLAPNPFNDNFSLQYNLPTSTDINVTLLDLPGNTVEIIQKGRYSGEQKLNYNTSKLAAGVYFLRIEADGRVITRKIVKQ